MRKTLILPIRRRREEKTNYRRRLALLKSKKPRVVARVTNANVSLQLVDYNGSDKTKFAYISKKLEEAGWKHSKNSIPACYLSGLSFGLLCKKNGVSEVVFDMGLARNTPGNRYLAVLKGIVDSGLQINFSEDKFPAQDRILGKHISPEIEKSFSQAKQKILGNYGK